jgi:hypothetical protein
MTSFLLYHQQTVQDRDIAADLGVDDIIAEEHLITPEEMQNPWMMQLL